MQPGALANHLSCALVIPGAEKPISHRVTVAHSEGRRRGFPKTPNTF